LTDRGTARLHQSGFRFTPALTRAFSIFVSVRMLGTVTPEQMVRWTADRVSRGGKSHGKPTHFEVRDGKY